MNGAEKAEAIADQLAVRTESRREELFDIIKRELEEQLYDQVDQKVDEQLEEEADDLLDQATEDVESGRLRRQVVGTSTSLIADDE